MFADNSPAPYGHLRMVCAVIPQRLRVLAVAPLVAAAALLLSACDVLTATGTGTVLVTSTSSATTYDPGLDDGDIAYLCASGSSSCTLADPYLYSYYPSTGETEWTATPGVQVIDRSGQGVGLPAGRYALQVTDYSGGARNFTNVIEIDVYGSEEIDLSVWHQSYGRESAAESCRDGWQPGWAQWPNDGTGGFVCDRVIYAYYPDLPVATGSTPGTPWLQSVARASADAACPDGYTPGWAQWPNEGTGGFVCNRTIT